MEEIDQVSESLIASRRKPKKAEPKLVTERSKQKEKAAEVRAKKAEQQKKLKEEKAKKKKQFETLQLDFEKIITWIEGEEGKDYFAEGAATEKKLSKHYNEEILRGRDLAKQMKKLRKKFKHQKYFQGFNI